MDKAGNCVVVGDRNRKVIGEIRDEEPEDYGNMGVCGFHLKDPDKTKRIDFMKLVQHLWDGD